MSDVTEIAKAVQKSIASAAPTLRQLLLDMRETDLSFIPADLFGLVSFDWPSRLLVPDEGVVLTKKQQKRLREHNLLREELNKDQRNYHDPGLADRQ